MQQSQWELQQLANELDLTLHICHFPPGTSKWNKVEHRLFAQITENTKTTTGLKINAVLDESKYPTGIQVSDEQINSILIEYNNFHGEWNYKILKSK